MKPKFVIVVVAFSLLSACENHLNAEKYLLPEPNSEGAVLYEKFCDACHLPPRIDSHKPDEWLNIVNRMQTHRIKKAYNPLNEQEKKTLVLYLKKHAAK